MNSPSRDAIDAIKAAYIAATPACKRETEELAKERMLDNANLMLLMIGHILNLDDPDKNVENVIAGIEDGLKWVRCLNNLPH